MLKYVAVAPAYQGQDLTSTVVSELKKQALEQGCEHLFLYTKPQNELLFTPLFFYTVAKTDRVLLMENRKDGIRRFLSALPAKPPSDKVGAIVMNADPFARGHRYLVECAAAQCDVLYVFAVSEDKGRFSAADRMEMMRRGTADLTNVTVLPTGPYLVSRATFPTYFLKDREAATDVHCALDVAIFARYFVPTFGITHRFVGSEPFSPTTSRYNDALREQLPKNGVQVVVVPRLENEGEAISAGRVRTLLESGDADAVRKLVPPTTLDYVKERS